MRAHLVAARFGENIGTVIVGPLGGYQVTLRWGVFELASTESRAEDGTFEFTKYRKDGSEVGSHRTLTLVLHDVAGREIRFGGGHHVSPRFKLLESGRVSFEDVDDEQIIEGDFLVNVKEAQGYLVTLGTGETPRTIAPGEVPPPAGPTVASGWGLATATP